MSRSLWWFVLLSGCQLFYSVSEDAAKDGGRPVDSRGLDTPLMLVDAPGSACSVIDEFEVTSAGCGTWGTPFPGSAMIEASDGLLVMRPVDVDAAIGCTSNASFTLGGDGISVELANALTAASSFTGLQTQGSPMLSFGVIDAELLFFMTGTAGAPYRAIDYDPHAMQFLRLRVDDLSTIVTEYSRDGSAWTPYFDLTGGITPGPFSLTASVVDDAVPEQAEFAHLRACE